MYTLSSKLRLTAIIFMIVGAIGLIYGFIAAPDSIEDVKEIMASEGGAHGEESSHSVEETAKEHEFVPSEHELVEEERSEGAKGDSAETEHYEHVLHQLQNKPWAAVYIAAFFFFMIALGTLAFYAINFAAQAGWSPVLFRVMEGISVYLLPGGIIIFILLLLSSFHLNHLFPWMDAELVAEDELLQNKSSYLNVPFFLIRALIYIAGWNIFAFLLRKNSLRIDEYPTEGRWFKKSFKLSAGFLVFFIVTESMMSWDWIMSLDPHWFSTLFGWYVFASMIVSAVTMIALVTIYLKSRGYLEYVNDSHIHDLAKFMFGFSIFWTYLWFSQFMLIWYSNIPEEVTYFVTRIEDYTLPFFGMVAMNFLFPVLLLMNSDYKRVNLFVVMTGVVVLLGHYLDIFVMIMPATVGESWFIGVSEISALLLFGGFFIFVVFTAITKAPLLPKGNPFITESKHFHY